MMVKIKKKKKKIQRENDIKIKAIKENIFED